MKFITAQSCKQLFFRSIIFSLLLNLFFYAFTIFMRFGSILYLCFVGVQLLFSLLLGLHIRKKNKILLLENQQEKKKFKNITLIGFIFLLIIITNMDIIAPFVYVERIFYKLFGLQRLITIFDFSCILVCLGAVFFNPKRLSYKLGKKANITSNAE